MSNNSSLNLILGERVKSLRLERNITREILAEKIDVSTRFLADVEAGKVGVSLSTLKNLCLALNTSADYLIGIYHPSDNQLQMIEITSKIENISPEYLPQIVKIIDAFDEAIKK